MSGAASLSWTERSVLRLDREIPYLSLHVVLIFVRDQERSLRFYLDQLGFQVVVDRRFESGERWVEVAPPGGGTSLALVPARGEYQPGRMTGIALESADPRADHEEMSANGIDVDGELLGGDGTVPLLFFFRDHDANHLMIVETPRQDR